MRVNNNDDSTPDEVEENSEPLNQPIVIPPELLEHIPVEERDDFSRKFASYGVHITREEHYSGPLPPFR